MHFETNKRQITTDLSVGKFVCVIRGVPAVLFIEVSSFQGEGFLLSEHRQVVVDSRLSFSL